LKRNTWILIIVVGVAFAAFFKWVYLPMAARQDQISRMADDLYPTDKLRQPSATIPPFSMTDQNGQTITEQDVKGHIHIADFFFTSCDAICPMMTSQLSRVQEAMGDERDYRILSFSLDSENDSVPVLRSFARKFGANDTVWHLLTGDKKAIYTLGAEGYKQSVLRDAENDINHSGRLILVDRNLQIRGFYNALDSLEVDMLINDLSYLLYKEEWNE